MPHRLPEHLPDRPSSWTRITVTPAQLRRWLQSRHWLRLHAFCIGVVTLALMLLTSAGLRHVGVTHLAARYALALSVGYVAYLLLVRMWAQCMLRREFDGGVDLPDVLPNGGGGSRQSGEFITGQGGDYGGGGANGSWDAQLLDGSLQPASGTHLGVGDVSGADAAPDAMGAMLDGAGSVLEGADEGAVILIPVLAVFAALLGAFFGMGWLLWLVFSSEVLLAVAIELAFAMLMARTLYRIEREGWLLAAIRLSWKPLLGALLCAVVVGMLLTHFFPEAQTWRDALQLWRER